MVAENQRLQKRLEDQVNLEGEVQHLINSGLMKMDDNGTVHHVETFEEHQRLQAQHLQEQQIAQQLMQQQ